MAQRVAAYIIIREVFRMFASQLPQMNEEFFKLIVEASPFGMLLVDREGQIIFANSAVESVFGYSRHELAGLIIEVLVPEASRSLHVKHRERLTNQRTCSSER